MPCVSNRTVMSVRAQCKCGVIGQACMYINCYFYCCVRNKSTVQGFLDCWTTLLSQTMNNTQSNFNNPNFSQKGAVEKRTNVTNDKDICCTHDIFVHKNESLTPKTSNIVY